MKRFAPMVCMRKMLSRGTDFSPNMVLIMIGKKPSSEAIRIFGPKPKPSHTTNNGPIATLGITWTTTSQGYKVCSSVRENTMAAPSSTPPMIDNRKPIRISKLVTRACPQRSPAVSMLRDNTLDGEGTR